MQGLYLAQHWYKKMYNSLKKSPRDVQYIPLPLSQNKTKSYIMMPVWSLETYALKDNIIRARPFSLIGFIEKMCLRSFSEKHWSEAQKTAGRIRVPIISLLFGLMC